MPTLKRKVNSGRPGEWYFHIPNHGSGPPVYTIQVSSAGRDILLNSDLDHDNSRKRAAYVSRDLYSTLNNLDLLDTEGDASNSADGDVQPTDDQSVEKLSPAQRVAFASSLVEHEPVERLYRSTQILTLFQSLSSEAFGYVNLLDKLLTETPFDSDTVLNSTDVINRHSSVVSIGSKTYDTTLLALFLKLVYESLSRNAGALFDDIIQSNEARELWLFHDSVGISGDELILQSLPKHVSLPETDWENTELEPRNIIDPHGYLFYRTIYPSVSVGQIENNLEKYQTTVEEQIQTKWLLLFPKPDDRSNDELKSPFLNM